MLKVVFWVYWCTLYIVYEKYKNIPPLKKKQKKANKNIILDKVIFGLLVIQT